MHLQPIYHHTQQKMSFTTLLELGQSKSKSTAVLIFINWTHF